MFITRVKLIRWNNLCRAMTERQDLRLQSHEESTSPFQLCVAPCQELLAAWLRGQSQITDIDDDFRDW
jgi:hypothetical protein